MPLPASGSTKCKKDTLKSGVLVSMALGHRIPSADRRPNALKCEKTIPKRSPANGYPKDIKEADTQATFGLDSHVNGQNTEMPQYGRIHSKNGPSIGLFEHPKNRPTKKCIGYRGRSTSVCDAPKSVLDTEVDLPRYATHFLLLF